VDARCLLSCEGKRSASSRGRATSAPCPSWPRGHSDIRARATPPVPRIGKPKLPMPGSFARRTTRKDIPARNSRERLLGRIRQRRASPSAGTATGRTRVGLPGDACDCALSGSEGSFSAPTPHTRGSAPARAVVVERLLDDRRVDQTDDRLQGATAVASERRLVDPPLLALLLVDAFPGVVRVLRLCEPVRRGRRKSRAHIL
jgi:hypothetical protein